MLPLCGGANTACCRGTVSVVVGTQPQRSRAMRTARAQPEPRLVRPLPGLSSASGPARKSAIRAGAGRLEIEAPKFFQLFCTSPSARSITVRLSRQIPGRNCVESLLMRYAVSAKVVLVGLAVHPIGLTRLRTEPAGIRDRGPMHAGFTAQNHPAMLPTNSRFKPHFRRN